MSEFGRLAQITDLSQIWRQEPYFSEWLAEDENLQLLSAAVRIDIVDPLLEAPVGKFSADILASEKATDNKIVIENQFGDTDHDHLGKLITYAVGRGAKYAIWIAQRVREPHKKVIERLNQASDENLPLFFLIQIEILRIGDSPLAPRFNIVQQPNEWAGSIKPPGALSETQKLQDTFWSAFKKHADEKLEYASSFRAFSWFSDSERGLGVVRGTASRCEVRLTVDTVVNRLTVGLCFTDKAWIEDKYSAKKEAMVQLLGTELDGNEGPKGYRILIGKAGNIRDESAWPAMFDWLCDNAVKFKEMAKEFVV